MGFSDNTEEAVMSNCSPGGKELYSHLNSCIDLLGGLGLADISYSKFSQLVTGPRTRTSQIYLNSKDSHQSGHL